MSVGNADLHVGFAAGFGACVWPGCEHLVGWVAGSSPLLLLLELGCALWLWFRELDLRKMILCG